MSLFGDLLGFGGSFLGDRARADAISDQAAASQDAVNKSYKLATAPRTDASGNVTSFSGDGGFKTTLAQGPQTLHDQLLQNNIYEASGRSQFGGIGNDLVDRFDASAVEGPLSRDDALGIINKDNSRFYNAVTKPALDNLTIQTQRTRGDTSNIGDFLAEATQQLLPSIQFGGEKEAIELSNNDISRFIDQTLGLGEQALAAASGGQRIALPTGVTAGDATNIANSVRVPNLGSGSDVLGNSLARIGATLNANEAATNASNERQQLINLLSRQLGNQGGNGINAATATI